MSRKTRDPVCANYLRLSSEHVGPFWRCPGTAPTTDPNPQLTFGEHDIEAGRMTNG